jgi:hypothetical protein
MLAGILSLFRLLATAVGWARERSQQETGAALQRGLDDGKELDRIVAASDAVPDSLSADENNRDNKPG